MISDDKPDSFLLDYLLSVTHEDHLPEIGKIRNAFAEMNYDEFISTIQHVMAENDRSSFQMLLYYIILFRDLDLVHKAFNDPETPIEILENLVLFAMGHCGLCGYTTDRILDEILYFVNNERLLELITTSRFIVRDKLLLFFILTKLDNAGINKYFQIQKDIPSFIKDFLRMPDEIMKSIISRNYKLFQYIMVMMAEESSTSENMKMFYTKYQNDIEQMSKIGDVIRLYRANTDLENEKNLSFENRNMERISFLVNKVRSMPDPHKAVDYFDGEKMFVDDYEKRVVLEVTTNPIFKDTFLYYGNIFATE